MPFHQNNVSVLVFHPNQFGISFPRASSRPRTNEFVAQSYCSSENSEEGRAACNGQAISQIELLALLPRELPRQ